MTFNEWYDIEMAKKIEEYVKLGPNELRRALMIAWEQSRYETIMDKGANLKPTPAKITIQPRVLCGGCGFLHTPGPCPEGRWEDNRGN